MVCRRNVCRPVDLSPKWRYSYCTLPFYQSKAELINPSFFANNHRPTSVIRLNERYTKTTNSLKHFLKEAQTRQHRHQHCVKYTNTEITTINIFTHRHNFLRLTCITASSHSLKPRPNPLFTLRFWTRSRPSQQNSLKPDFHFCCLGAYCSVSSFFTAKMNENEFPSILTQPREPTVCYRRTRRARWPI